MTGEATVAASVTTFRRGTTKKNRGAARARGVRAKPSRTFGRFFSKRFFTLRPRPPPPFSSASARLLDFFVRVFDTILLQAAILYMLLQA
jgi:hypothetical protein